MLLLNASRLACLLSAVAPALAAQGIGRLQVSADPPKYHGKAPARIHFIATIELRGTRTFQYHWIRSDGARSPVRTLNLSNPAQRVCRVVEEWLVVTPGKNQLVWQKIVVTSGKFQVTSDPAVAIVNSQ
jgi:hypothetical protein